jgi:hypothetical protein
MTVRRGAVNVRLKVGDVVVRRHRLIKTQGTILRFDGEDENGLSCVWVKWNHPTTLPNPSREPVDALECVSPAPAPS